MQKRYHNTTNLILIGCMAVAAFTGCSGKTDEKQTQADTGSKREKMIAKLVERLEANGFVCTDENERYYLYKKSGVTQVELTKQLGLKSTDEFKHTLNSNRPDSPLRARLADNVYCMIDDPDAPDEDASVTTPFRKVWVWIGRESEVLPVIKIGMEVGDAKPALDNACAKLISSGDLPAVNANANENGRRWFNRYELPDGTQLEIARKCEFKTYRITAISVGPEGNMRAVEQFDMTPFLPAEGE